MTDYSKMSDYEINKAVGLTVGYATGIEPCFEVVIINKTGRPFDPCNNPADAWPIIVTNRIMMNPYCADDLWKCEVPCADDGFMKTYSVSYDKNPLRAAMIAFLMMKEAGNV